jgi:hypothetical protein
VKTPRTLFFIHSLPRLFSSFVAGGHYAQRLMAKTHSERERERKKEREREAKKRRRRRRKTKERRIVKFARIVELVRKKRSPDGEFLTLNGRAAVVPCQADWLAGRLAGWLGVPSGRTALYVTLLFAMLDVLAPPNNGTEGERERRGAAAEEFCYRRFFYVLQR